MDDSKRLVERSFRGIAFCLLLSFLNLCVPPVWALPAPEFESKTSQPQPTRRGERLDPQLQGVLDQGNRFLPKLPSGLDPALEPSLLAQVDPDPQDLMFPEKKSIPQPQATPEQTPHPYAVPHWTPSPAPGWGEWEAPSSTPTPQPSSPTPDAPQGQHSSPTPTPTTSTNSSQENGGSASSDSGSGHDDGHQGGQGCIPAHHPDDFWLPPERSSSVTVPGVQDPVPPQLFSRQTHAGGQFIPMPAFLAYSNDDRVYLRQANNNVTHSIGTVIRWDFFSPNPESNKTARKSAATIEWRYHAIGNSTYGLSASSTKQVKVWDRHSPSGRIISSQSFAYFLKNLDLSAGVCCRDVGNWTVQIANDNQTPIQQVFSVTNPGPTATAWERQKLNGIADASQAPYVAYTSDQWLRHSAVYVLNDSILKTDSDGRKSCDIVWHFRSPDSSANHNRYHAFWTTKTEYRSNPDGYRLATILYDQNDPQGRLLNLQQGNGTLPQVTLTFGEGLPSYGNWKFSEHINDQRTTTQTFQVRDLQMAAGTQGVDCYPDNGGMGYRVSITANPPEWQPGNVTWQLALKNPIDNSTYQSFQGTANFTNNQAFVYQNWNGQNQSGHLLPVGSQVYPELQINQPDDPTLISQLPSTTTLARAAPVSRFSFWENLIALAIVFFPKLFETPALATTTFGSGSGVFTLCGGLSATNTLLPITTIGCTIQVWRNGVYLQDLPSSGILTVGSYSFDSQIGQPPQSYVDAVGNLTFFAVSSSGATSRGFGPVDLVKNSTSSSAGQPPSSFVGIVNQYSVGYPVESSALGFPPGAFAQFGVNVTDTGATLQQLQDFTAQPIDYAGARNYKSLPGPVPSAIDVGTGRTMAAYNDLTIRTRGIPIVLNRYFLSENQFTNAGPQALMWQWSFNRRLELSFNTSGTINAAQLAKALYVTPDGQVNGFIASPPSNYPGNTTGNATFNPARPDQTDSLVQTGAQTFVLTTKHGTSYTFQIQSATPVNDQLGSNQVVAVMTREADANGNANTYTWSNNTCVSIAGPDDQQVALRWAGYANTKYAFTQTVPSVIYDQVGNRQISYRYSFDTSTGAYLQLNKVYLPGPRIFQYGYTLSPQGQLLLSTTAVSNSANIQAKIVPNGLSPDQADAVSNLNQATQFSSGSANWPSNAQLGPNAPSTQVVSNLTTTSNGAGATPLGQSQTWSYSFDALGHANSITNPVGGNRQFQFDPADNILSVQDELGYTTDLTWDANRNPTSITNALGNQTQLVWDSYSNLKRVKNGY